MEVDLPLGATETWAYSVRANPGTGCWTARSLEEHGAYQDQVDAYGDRETLAPSKSETRALVRYADRLHVLEGCIPQGAQPETGDTPTEAIARFASPGVQREFPGKQRGTSCRSRGKYTGFGPDSYEFLCETRLANGRKYVDAISCYDPPPYLSLDSCTEQDGYPRRARRPLP